MQMKSVTVAVDFREGQVTYPGMAPMAMHWKQGATYSVPVEVAERWKANKWAVDEGQSIEGVAPEVKGQKLDVKPVSANDEVEGVS